MKNQRRHILMFVMLAGLAGCGLKGPLYFPPNDKPAKPPITATDNVNKNQPEAADTQQPPSISNQ